MNLSFRSPVSSWLRFILAGVFVTAGASLAACSGGVIGSGNSPQRLVIAAPSTVAPLPQLLMHECLTSGLRALLYFSDNSVGDFTARVVWSSSNTGAVKVSNGDIQIPGTNSFYANGALIPQGTGSSIITANYFGIISQTEIVVEAPQSIDLQALVEGVYTPLNQVNLNSTSSSTGLTLASGTSLQLAAIAVLDGVQTDVSSFATFGFQIPNDSVATIAAGTSTIKAVGNSSASVVPVVSFASCPLTNINYPARSGVNLTVSPIQSLSLVPEFLPDPTQPYSATNTPPPLIVNNTEKFKAIATLATGDQQDVSAQSVFTASSPASSAVFSGGASGVGNNILTTTAVTPLFVSASITANDNLVTSPSMGVPTVSRTLFTLTACTTALNVAIPAGQNCPSQPATTTLPGGSLTPIQLHAIGFFGYDLDASGNPTIPVYQEVTRQTVWTTAPTGIVNISASGNTSGQLTGSITSGGVTTIQGNDSAAQTLTTSNSFQIGVLPVTQTPGN